MLLEQSEVRRGLVRKGGLRHARMGQSASKSIARYTNDYELVIRASKALETLLEDEFLGHGPNAASAPGVGGKRQRAEPSLGLHDKISLATTRDGKPLPATLVKQMRYLATVRNRLVHDRGFDAIPDRPSFVAAFDEAEAQLRALLPERARAGGCVLC